MVVTLNGPVAEFLEEFSKLQQITTDEALMQLLLPLARIYLHGKQCGIQETGAGVFSAIENLDKLGKE